MSDDDLPAEIGSERITIEPGGDGRGGSPETRSPTVSTGTAHDKSGGSVVGGASVSSTVPLDISKSGSWREGKKKSKPQQAQDDGEKKVSRLEQLHNYAKHYEAKREERANRYVHEPNCTFTPKINNNYKISRDGDTYSRLAAPITPKKAEVTEVSYSWQPKINRTSSRQRRSVNDLCKWEEAKQERLKHMRKEKESTEMIGFSGTPYLSRKSEEMCGRRDGAVWDRLITIGNQTKQRQEEERLKDQEKFKDESCPSISSYAAAMTDGRLAHERLYQLKPKDCQSEVGHESVPDEACTFQPSISKKSHRLAGGDLPKYEKIEDRLLRQGEERKQRNSEHAYLLKKQDEEARSGQQHVGPYSRLLLELAERNGRAKSFMDPIGVDNKETVDTLEKKHSQAHAFRPYVGSNSREIDKQIHGDRELRWEERLGNLYYKEHEKENRLQRLRGKKEEEEVLLCKASQAAMEKKADSSLHARNKAWKQRLENKRRWGKHQKEEEEIKECTFQPVINKRSGSVRSRKSASPVGRRSPAFASQPRVSMSPDRLRRAPVGQPILTSSPPQPISSIPSPTYHYDPGAYSIMEEEDEEIYDEHDPDRLALLSQLEHHSSFLQYEGLFHRRS